MHTRSARSIVMLVFLLSVLFSGCASLGPKSIPRDRFDYAAAVSDSWKDQMLLNLVKIRYAEAPVFMDIASVINSYTLEGSFSAGGSVQSPLNPVAGNANTLSLGAAGRYADTPTITYNPMTGDKFSKSLMRPIPPGPLFSLIQMGWSAEFLLDTCVQAVNGMYNRLGIGAESHPADADFDNLVNAIARLQKVNGLGVWSEKGMGEDAAMVFFRKRKDEAAAPARAEVQRLLGLDSSAGEFRVVYGMMPRQKNEVAVLTRSMLVILLELSSSIDVPAAHAAEQRVFPVVRASEGRSGQLIRVHSSTDRPQDSFVAVRYRDHWFWIDDRDLYSKRTFSFLMVLFTLTETGGGQAVPVVTVPAH